MPNNTTQSANSQHPPMTPDRAKAALGNATLLQSFLLPAHQAQPAQPQAQETASPSEPQPTETAEPKDSPQEEKKEDVGEKLTEMQLEMTKQLDAMRQEMKTDQAREMQVLKDTITNALQGEKD